MNVDFSKFNFKEHWKWLGVILFLLAWVIWSIFDKTVGVLGTVGLFLFVTYDLLWFMKIFSGTKTKK